MTRDAARLISETAKQKTYTQPEHDWAMMSRLLGPVEAVLDAPQSPGTSNDEYFPDREEKEKALSSIYVVAEVTSVSESTQLS